MKSKLLFITLSFAAMIVIVVACSKESNSNGIPAKTDYSFTEEFDTVSKAVAKGWMIVNNTRPIGTMSWMQAYFYVSMHHNIEPGKLGGSTNVNYSSTGGFGDDNNPSYSGADFILTSASCGTGQAEISNWLISPETIMKDGDEVSFYTRTYKNPATAADRLQVRINTAGGPVDVGTESSSTGSFDNVLLDINPELLLDGDNSYPGVWTKYSVRISGLPVPKKARIALRYYVPDGGPLGNNSVGIGIDKFSFISF